MTSLVQSRSKRWFVAVTFLALVAVASGAAVATVPDAGQQAVASCTAQPTTVTVGEDVTLDASSSDASYVEFDIDGDGEYDQIDETDFIITVTYAEPGTYEPFALAQLNPPDEDSCGTITVEAQNQPPSASLSVSPATAAVGQTVSFDASGSSDPDGSIVAYRWDFDGDGSFDRQTDTPMTDHSYGTADSYVPTVTVIDDDGLSDSASRDVTVQAQVTAACTVQPSGIAPGEAVTIDATNSENGQYLDYDPDGDGEYEVLERTTFTYQTSYDSPGTYTPRVRVHGNGQTDTADCGDVTVTEENEPPTAAFSISPQPSQAGTSMTFDGSASSDPDGSIVAYRWDFDGDGTTDETTTSATTSHTYATPNSYVPGLQVVDDDDATGFTSRDHRVVERPDLQPACTVEPTQVAPGDPVTIDARGSENAQYLDYDPDGDGEYEVLERTSFTHQTAYDDPGTYTPLVRVHGNGQTAVAECPPVTVEEPNEPPNAVFTVDPRGPTPGETVTFDGSNSSDSDGRIVAYRWDFNGDGTFDTTTSGPTVTHAYNGTGPIVAALQVVDDDNATDRTSRDLEVTTVPTTTTPPPDEDEGIPLIPIGLGGLGLVGLGGLLWYVFGGGGGAGGPAGGDPPAPKPKPTPSTETPLRYETGVFRLPSTSGTVAVPIGFEPDLLLFSATNAARTDTATDRTAGWSRGLAHATGDGVENRSVTVADDAHNTDQATCATDLSNAVHLVRHQPDAAPGRVRGTVARTTTDGFEVDVSVPGDDPLAGGIRVLYQAIRTPSSVDIGLGHFHTPTEPGTQTVDLGVDADHVSMLGSAAVTEGDRLWTTDRGVGLTVGQAVLDPETGIDQVVCGESGWPGAGHDSAAVCRTDRALHLLYQDADRLASRTSASVGALGERLRLQYDRVYNGPHKLGSTERHVVPYLATAGGDAMRPAVGAVPLPGPEESLTIECGFQPAMLEVTLSGAAIGDEIPAEATPSPFGWSYGTAIVTDDRLRQYVLHHALQPELPTASVAAETTAATDSARAATDGGATDEAANRDAVAGTRDLSATDDDTIEAPTPPESPDDERVGIHLLQTADGTIVGRDEVRVTGLRETGFDVAIRRIAADGAAPRDGRPTLCYRAWSVGDDAIHEAGEETTAEDDRPAEEPSSDPAAEPSERTGDSET